MSQAPTSLFWYDLETFGRDPAKDRIGQFAGIRTDLDFKPIGDEIDLRCAPTWDILPDPVACEITGVTPLDCVDGLCENDFAEAILTEFMVPGTCVIGYNNLRFDDEFVRQLLYRNLRDPYAREWKNHCSRWDLLDIVRLCRALRPEGIEWPEHNDGRASNKLEDLSAANQLEHSHAHDALSDVRATIGVAKMLRDAQPKLYQYAFDNRDKQSTSQLLSTQHKKPVLHISGMLPAAQGHASLVMPLAPHPSNKNGVIVCDLNVSPDTWLSLSTEELQQRLFTRADELPEGSVRPPIKVVHINRTPVLAPAGVLDDHSAQRLGIDAQRALSHRQQILDSKDAAMRVRLAFDSKPASTPEDPDLQLYGGGFFSDADRRRMTKISSQAPLEQLPASISFDDERLPVLVQRYRARNWPDSLSKPEKESWREEILAKLEDPTRVATTRMDFERQVARMAINPDSADMAQRLLSYRDALYGIESGEED